MTAEEKQALDTRLAALEAAGENLEKQSLVLEASRLGKAIPLSAEDIAATPLAVLKNLVKGLPAGEVPLAADGLSQAAQKGAPALEDGTGLTEADKAVAKMLGLDPADVAKTNGLRHTAAAA